MNSKHIIPNKTTFYSFLVLFLCCLFQFYKYVLEKSPAIITDDLMREFNLTGAGLGGLSSAFYWTYLITQLFVGILLDKFKVRYIASIAIFTCSLGALLFSYSSTFWAAWLSRGLMGMGVAFTTVTFLKLASIWFKSKYFPFVSSLVATSTVLGGYFGQVPLADFIKHDGWRHCISVIAFFGFALAAIYFIVIRDKPKAMLLTQEHKKKYSWEDILSVIKNKQNWILMTYAGLVFAPFDVFCALWGLPFLQEAYHLDVKQSATLAINASIGFGIGCPLLGLLSSWIGNMRAVMVSFTLISCTALCIVIYCPNLPPSLLSPLLFIFGFCLGTYMLVFSATKAANAPHLTATACAMINMGDYLIPTLETGIGKLLDLNWDGKIVNGAHHFSLDNYHIALASLPILLIISAGLLFAITRPINKEEEIASIEPVLP